jgi:hypothetical protein
MRPCSSGRTLFPSTVATKPREERALISGVNSRKIGGEIVKGKWKGFPVYTLTLEERATCPRSCQLWRSCYGNKMQYAQRLSAGGDLEWRVEREVAAIALRHRRGFAIRLHNLGDFYSVDYVSMWERLLDEFPALHAWGYSARIDAADPICIALRDLIARRWDRFAVRFSGATSSQDSSIVIRKPRHAPVGSIICPEQVGKTESCSTCGLCWATRKRIAFLRH